MSGKRRVARSIVIDGFDRKTEGVEEMEIDKYPCRVDVE